MRNELTKSFDRASKLHQREFEVLPMVWDEVHVRNYAFWSQLNHAQCARQSALNKISRHAIFLDEAMRDDLFNILARLNGALIEHEANQEVPMLRRSERLDKDISWVRGEGLADMDSVEARIRGRLWSTGIEAMD